MSARRGFGGIVKFGGQGAGFNGAGNASYQVSAGFDYEALSFDVVYSHVSDAITLSSLSAAQLAYRAGGHSLASTVSDNSAVLLSAKYTYNQFKFFGGYEYINYADPKNPITTPFVDSNGYNVAFATSNAYQYHDKILQLFWTGVKYAYDSHLAISAGYYHELQNSYGNIGCNYATNNKLVTNAATCSGTEDAVGLVAEYHFNKRFEAYGGVMYSVVANGMANGFPLRQHGRSDRWPPLRLLERRVKKSMPVFRENAEKIKESRAVAIIPDRNML